MASWPPLWFGDGLLDDEDLAPAVLVDPRAVAEGVLDHHGVAVGLAGVVEVQLAAVARERHAEQAALALVDHLVGDVEQRRGLQLVGELAFVCRRTRPPRPRSAGPARPSRRCRGRASRGGRPARSARRAWRSPGRSSSIVLEGRLRRRLGGGGGVARRGVVVVDEVGAVRRVRRRCTRRAGRRPPARGGETRLTRAAPGSGPPAPR